MNKHLHVVLSASLFSRYSAIPVLASLSQKRCFQTAREVLQFYFRYVILALFLHFWRTSVWYPALRPIWLWPHDPSSATSRGFQDKDRGFQDKDRKEGSPTPARGASAEPAGVGTNRAPKPPVPGRRRPARPNRGAGAGEAGTTRGPIGQSPARLANHRAEALLWVLIGFGGDAHHTGLGPLHGSGLDGGRRRTRGLRGGAELLQSCVGRSWCGAHAWESHGAAGHGGELRGVGAAGGGGEEPMAAFPELAAAAEVAAPFLGGGFAFSPRREREATPRPVFPLPLLPLIHLQRWVCSSFFFIYEA